MAYTVKKLAEISGVSVRTLRFYDEIGLLPPARVGENGYRYYEEEQVHRLQQILFYRELGFPLNEIQAVMQSDSFDKVEALHAHRAALKKSVEKTSRLIATIDCTIAKLKGEGEMKDSDLFVGFSPEKQAEYEKYLEERFGAGETIAASKKSTKGWTRGDYSMVAADYDKVHRELTDKLRSGVSPRSDDVQDIVRRHYEIVCRFWRPDANSYAGLGRLYLDHPDFKKLYDSYDPGLADYLAEAMRAFAAGLTES